MPLIPDFDMDDVLRTIDYVSQSFPTGSREEDALQLAAISLLYVQRMGKLDDFRPDSGPCRSPIPEQADHLFRTMPISDSGHADHLPSGGETGRNRAVAGSG